VVAGKKQMSKKEVWLYHLTTSLQCHQRFTHAGQLVASSWFMASDNERKMKNAEWIDHKRCKGNFILNIDG
jgi:hypothetical protein